MYQVLILIGYTSGNGAGASSQIVDYKTEEEALAAITQIEKEGAVKLLFTIKALPLWVKRSKP